MIKELWTTKKTYKVFSLMIRERDKACVKCGRISPLDCSHFWTRNNSSTRYDFDNCDTLCKKCHFEWEHDKQGRYRDFMIRKLGEEDYKKLDIKTHEFMSRRDAIKEFQDQYEKNK